MADGQRKKQLRNQVANQSEILCNASFNNLVWHLEDLIVSLLRLILWPWEITFVPLWIVLCISLVGVLYTIIFAGILLRMPEVNAEQRRTSTNSALGENLVICR